MMMPHMDGHVLSERLRADPRTQHLPILLMTATRYNVLTQAASAMVAKPFDLDAIVALVQSFIAIATSKTVSPNCIVEVAQRKVVRSDCRLGRRPKRRV
jgi:CheY-like chemotaxis protein